jgi:hypothetical protein
MVTGQVLRQSNRGIENSMRILPDTRDLINLLQHGQPVTVEEFERYLQSGNHEIVLSNTNVREFAGPLASGAEFMELRPLFQALERMPHTCLRDVGILADEIQAAVEAFNAGAEYQAPTPYVRRWDDTLSMPGQHQSPAADWVNFRLDDIIYALKGTRPDVFAPPAHALPKLQEQFENGRNQLRAGRAPARQHFIDSTKQRARGMPLPAGREDEFAEWVYANPNRCPGLRLFQETYRALMENYDDIPETGDFSDLAHVSTLPYLEAATLDRRMRNYCGIAARKMLKLGATYDYSGRLYQGLDDLMRRNPQGSKETEGTPPGQ